MELRNYDFAVIGGDKRQVYTKKLLDRQGYRVCHYGLCDELFDKDSKKSSLEEVIRCAHKIIAPIPLTSDKIHLNHKTSEKNLTLQRILDALQEGQVFFGGCLPDAFLV